MEKQKYTLSIKFESDDKNSKAFHAALAQVCEAWDRHKRILGPVCELTSDSQSQEDKDS